ILRSNYLTPEGVRFYDRSLKLYEELSSELNFNLMFSQMGHMSLAHDDGGVRTMRWRAEVNKAQGVDSEVIGPDEIKELVPYLDTSENTRYPILGALYHPPGGTIRHDAVVWAYARSAHEMCLHIIQHTEVTSIYVMKCQVPDVLPSQGNIATGTRVNSSGGWASLISYMAGVRMPDNPSPLQAALNEPVKPYLGTVVVSGTLHV